MEKRAYEKTGKAISKAERFGEMLTGKIFARLFGAADDGSRKDWPAEAGLAKSLQEPVKTRFLIYIICAIFLILLLWAALAPLDEVVHGTGKAKPTSGTQVIQAVDGGMVEEILVHESDVVQKDAVIIKINPTRFTSSLGERQAQVMSLMAKAARLDALTKGHPFEPAQEVIKAVPNIVEHERKLYQTSIDELRSNLRVAREQANQRRQELVEAAARLSQLTSACELAKDELKATKNLLASGAVSELEVIRLQKESARAIGDRNQAQAQLTRTKAAINEADGQLRETEFRFTNAWRNELTATLRELESLTEGNKALVDRVSQAEIKAPISGTIKRLFVNTTGAVVMPGGSVAEIVSDEDELVVEAQLSPNDRAFVRAGQKVIVKFTAYEYAVYGGLDGAVEYIGPDTITDERGNTYYTVRIKTTKKEFGADKPILPGMVAQVDIITGKKTILSYLLKPLMRAKEKAFREH
ncbi:MAG: HlyD family type I secretion periplasmic adaptor subunit [Cloacibacillus sp.]